MKNFDLSLFLGCCAIAFGIVIAGKTISAELPNTTQVPSSLSVVTQTEGEKEFGKYLDKYEACDYLKLYKFRKDVDELLESGILDGTYTMVDDTYIFSRQKLDEWVEERIETDPTE
ncbi:MAG: hypothetical protein IJW77_08725 [Clostridia bacterium]|nr:hypothetical protein [Clostridia bacterium]